MQLEKIIKVSHMINFEEYWLETNQYLHRLMDRCNASGGQYFSDYAMEIYEKASEFLVIS